MKLDFAINKYLLMWYLLYQSSISEDIHKLKQKLWIKYKKEYSSLYSDKSIILEENKDYIPDDDTIFNLVENSDAYKKAKSDTNRYRLTLMQIWDQNRKNYLKELNNILKMNLNDDYNIMVVHPNLNVVDINKSNNLIVVGKKITTRDKDNFLTYLFYKILKKHFESIKLSDREIVNTILELITVNELYTRVTKESKYNYGKKENYEIKCRLYPYWLMYLGVKEEKFDSYMVRDNIFFNIKDYEYNAKLKDMDIYNFIGYCVNHKRKILKKKTVTVEDIEII